MKTIQKTLLAALCCTMALTAQAQERTFQRNKVLVEKHTGQGCSACPGADKILLSHLAETNNEDNVAIMRHYNYPSAGTVRLDLHNTLNIWGINAWPKLLVDRFGFVDSEKANCDSHYFDASVLRSYNAIERRKQTPTYLSLSLDGSTYDPDTRKLHITLSGEVTKELPYLRAHAFITQSGIKGYQAGQSSDYIHDDVSRDYLMNNALGDPLKVTDGKYSVTFEKTLSERYGSVNFDPENTKVVVFIESYYNSDASYYEKDYSTCEVHNADIVSLLDLPKEAPCAMPTIELKDGSFVFKSTTPGAVCQHDVKPLMQPTAEREGAIDLDAPAFVVTAYANAKGYATSSTVSRTFSLRDILGAAVTDVRDVDGSGQVDKTDIDALVSKLLKK